MADPMQEFVRQENEHRAQAGTGILTATQEIRLNLNQSICAQKIDGKMYLFTVSLAAAHRLHCMGKEGLCPPAVKYTPFTVATALRAIDFLTDEDYLNVVRIVQDVINGPTEVDDIKKSKPEDEVPRLVVYELYMKALETVLHPNMLPVVAGDPATAYQRSVTYSMTVNLKVEFMKHIQLRKSSNASEARVMTRVAAALASIAASAPRPAPYGAGSGGGQGVKGGNQGNGGGAGKGGFGGKGNGGNGGGKGKGKGKGKGGVNTCLDWMQGNCPGSGRSTCPNGHMHCGTIARLDWLNTRFLAGALTGEQLMALSQQTDNS